MNFDNFTNRGAILGGLAMMFLVSTDSPAYFVGFVLMFLGFAGVFRKARQTRGSSERVAAASQTGTPVRDGDRITALERISQLQQDGHLTADEFETAKQAILSAR